MVYNGAVFLHSLLLFVIPPALSAAEGTGAAGFIPPRRTLVLLPRSGATVAIAKPHPSGAVSTQTTTRSGTHLQYSNSKRGRISSAMKQPSVHPAEPSAVHKPRTARATLPVVRSNTCFGRWIFDGVRRGSHELVKCCLGPSVPVKHPGRKNRAPWPTFARRERRKNSAIPVKNTRDTKSLLRSLRRCSGQDDGPESRPEKTRTLNGAG